MNDALIFITAIEWLVLGVVGSVKVRNWNRRLQKLYHEMDEAVQKWNEED